MERIIVSEQFRLSKTNCSFEAEFNEKIDLREVYKVMEAAVKALNYEDPYTTLWLQDLSDSFSNSKPYRFYTYYKCADLEPNHTVGDYKNAHKLFLPVDLEEINEDFPLQPSEEDDC